MSAVTRLQQARSEHSDGKSKAKRRTRPPTFAWSEIPQWQKDNEYIISGYRGQVFYHYIIPIGLINALCRELGSWQRCLSSAFTYFHNETVNIQSHYVGGLVFTLLWMYHLRTIFLEHQETLNVWDKTFMAFFMTGALICLILSGSYHMMCCHSRHVKTVFHRFDYAGIVTLTVGSFYPAVYYGFYCNIFFARIWLSILTIAGGSASYAVLSPTYSTPAYRRVRTYLFIALGLGGALPLLHAGTLEGYGYLRTLGVDWLWLSAALYIGGALIYAERFPERIWPGKFDYLFASHQIFHVCVVLAALSHYVAMIWSINHWHGVHKGQCPVA